MHSLNRKLTAFQLLLLLIFTFSIMVQGCAIDTKTNPEGTQGVSQSVTGSSSIQQRQVQILPPPPPPSVSNPRPWRSSKRLKNRASMANSSPNLKPRCGGDPDYNIEPRQYTVPYVPLQARQDPPLIFEEDGNNGRIVKEYDGDVYDEKHHNDTIKHDHEMKEVDAKVNLDERPYVITFAIILGFIIVLLLLLCLHCLSRLRKKMQAKRQERALEKNGVQVLPPIRVPAEGLTVQRGNDRTNDRPNDRSYDRSIERSTDRVV